MVTCSSRCLAVLLVACAAGFWILPFLPRTPSDGPIGTVIAFAAVMTALYVTAGVAAVRGMRWGWWLGLGLSGVESAPAMVMLWRRSRRPSQGHRVGG